MIRVRPDWVFVVDDPAELVPGGAGAASAPTVTRTARPARGVCLHLGPLLDGPRQAPCRCRYECEAGAAEYAVPGGVCQRCPQWERDR